MDIKDVAFVIEDLTLKAQMANSLLLAISTAMAYGPYASTNFEYGLSSVTDTLHELSAGLEEQTKALFEILKLEREAA